MKNIENKKIFKNLLTNTNIKSLIRSNLAKDLFIIDNNNLNIVLNKEISENSIAKTELTELKNLNHMHLKYLTFNAYLTNNLKPTFSKRATAYYNLFERKKSIKARLISSARGGYLVLTSLGIIGFIYKKEFYKLIKTISIYQKNKNLNFVNYYNISQTDTKYSIFNFETKIKETKLIIPKINKTNIRYKSTQYINLSLTPCISLKTK